MELQQFVKSIDRQLEIQMQKLQSSVESFCALTSVPVSFYSKRHELVWECSKVEKFCITNEAYLNTSSPCRKKLAEAMDNASRSVGTYMFFCNTGLINMAYAYRYKGDVIGYFMAGPIATGNDQKTVIREFYTRLANEKLNMPLLVSMTNNLKVYSMDELQDISSVFYDIINSSRIGDCEENRISSAAVDQSMLLKYEGKSSVIYSAITFIGSNYRSIGKIDEIADYVRVSKSYLSSLFKKETGISIIDYLNQLRLEFAAFELKNSDCTITEVAMAAGYRDTSYFSKLFSEKYGLSPREWRKVK